MISALMFRYTKRWFNSFQTVQSDRLDCINTAVINSQGNTGVS